MLRNATVQTVIANLAILGTGLVNAIALARWLGPEGRGEVAAVLLWPMLLVYCGSLGLMDSITYSAARGEASVKSIVGTSTVLALLQSAVLVPLGYVLMPVMLSSQRDDIVQASKIYLSVIPISLVSQYYAAVLQGRLAMRRFNAIRLIIPIGYLMATIALRMNGMLVPENVMMVNLGLNALALCAASGAILGVSSRSRSDRMVDTARGLLSFGLKAYPGSLASQLNVRLDQSLLAAWVSPAQLGLYVTAISAGSVIQIVPAAIQMVATPTIAMQRTGASAAHQLRQNFGRALMLTGSITLMLALLVPWILPTVYGEEFSDAVLAAEILLVGYLFSGMAKVLTGGAQALGNPGAASKAEMAGLVVTVAMFVALVPLLGIVGAAIACTLANATTLVFLVSTTQKLTSIGPKELFNIRPVLVRAAMCRTIKSCESFSATQVGTVTTEPSIEGRVNEEEM